MPILQYPIGNKRTSYEIPNYIEIIERYVFAFSPYLQNIIIPDSVIEMDINPFYNCISLIYVTYQGLKQPKCNEYIFDENTNVKFVNVPYNYQDTSFCYSNVNNGPCGKDSSYHFDNKTKTMTIEGTGYMENYTIGCDEIPWDNYKNYIEKVVIKEGIERIGSSSFMDCENLKSIELSDSVTTLGEYSFENCISLIDINLSDSLKTIESGVFKSCISLKQIQLPKIMEKIERQVFYNCKSLMKIEISNGIKEIYERTFEKCSSLEEIILPESIISISNYAFSECISLKKVEYLGTNEPECDNTTFSGDDKLEYVKVPINYKDGSFCSIEIEGKINIIGIVCGCIGGVIVIIIIIVIIIYIIKRKKQQLSPENNPIIHQEQQMN